MALLAGVVLWRVNAQISVTQWTEHSGDVLLLAKDAEVEFRQMRTAFRSYVVSPETQYLTELESGERGFRGSARRPCGVGFEQPATGAALDACHQNIPAG